MSKTSTDAKKTMLLHSEAKVEFLKKYLQRYLRILYRARTIQEINIFDVFCGTGIYDNGKKGSPIVSFEAISAIRDQYDFDKTINLIVNDSKAEKIDTVREHIDAQNQNHCSVAYHKLSADEMFTLIRQNLAGQARNVRNLIFVDPYGYKEIKKNTLEDLLKNNRTEIILFLPISQMQRFTKTAVTSDSKPYEPLKKFVYSFFPVDHPIRKETVSALEYIKFVKEALKFDQYYSTSYSIERDESNYYALFFISPSIYGFEKILEVKWELDEDSGGGFRQPVARTLFDLQDKELQKLDNYEQLERLLRGYLKKSRTNQEVYEFVLMAEFLPKHATEIFRNWQGQDSRFRVTDITTGKAVPKGRFYINWESYNPAKNQNAKVTLFINQN
jgi:three-Cys-motif partner protein